MHRVPTLHFSSLLFVISCAVIMCFAIQASAICPPVPADITGDDNSDVIDVQCSILSSLFFLSASVGNNPSIPPCLAGPPLSADLNCDNQVNVTDIQLTILIALGLGLDVAIDVNGDNCVDACGIVCTPPDCIAQLKNGAFVPFGSTFIASDNFQIKAVSPGWVGGPPSSSENFTIIGGVQP